MTHNVANASTVGFKKDRSSFQEYLVSGISGLNDSDDGKSMTDLAEVRTDFSPGAQFSTGNPLDIALTGKGFLSLDGGRYTRKGDLQVNREGYLVTATGRQVLGAGGPIQIPTGGKVEISPNGQVTANGTAVDTLKIVDFEKTTSLVPLSDGEYKSSDAPVDSAASVASGHLESSERGRGEGNGSDDHDDEGVRDLPESHPRIRRRCGAREQRDGEGLTPGSPARKEDE